MTSVLELLRAQADRAPAQPALLAPDRAPMTYADLLTHVQAVADGLAEIGITRTDRVAVVLPNGPDLAVALLGTIAAAQSAPLAADHPRLQFERELTRLRARAVLVQHGADTEARDAASALGVPIIEVEPGASAGACTLEATTSSAPTDAGGAGGVALLLFTSGTTSEPKLVPLTEESLLCSAASVARTLELDATDRCLNVMPLFHIHGLVAGLLASLSVGASVICTPGFVAADIAAWIEELRPTWYTAVPTIHQAVLETAQSADLRGAFRLIRSSSAALSPSLLHELEDAFGAPVIEAYGMTEAAHQMASNPLPPATRKPGTVGRPAGVEIAVLDADGRSLEVGSVGEIAIKGSTVMSGYVDNPDANAAAFVDGWFRTGDEGRIDADGYITITGRLKEIINRGGEKVAPREVDEALLAHPDVRSASAFAVPHPRLGEEVGAAVVLRPGAVATTAELRMHVAKQLEPFKVPRRIVVVDDIPRGPTGKIERRRLASALGLDQPRTAESNRPAVPPRDEHEQAVALLVQQVLGLDELPSVEADFFDLGGDSLHATALLVDIESQFGRQLPATIFLSGATIRGLSDALRSGSTAGRGASISPVQPEGSLPPLFCLLRGGSVVAVRHFARTLGPEQPVYGVWYPAMHGTRKDAGSVEEIATGCVAALRKTQPHGPYFLFGHSMGGVVMYEVARQLTDQGEVIGLLALADGAHPKLVAPKWRRRAWHVRRMARKALSRSGLSFVRHEVRRALNRRVNSPDSRVTGSEIRFDIGAALARERNYHPSSATWPVAIFATSAWIEYGKGPDLGWAPLLQNDWTSDLVPGSHDTMIGEPHVHVLAAKLAERLYEAQERLPRVAS